MSKGTNTVSTQDATPWIGVQPSLTNLYNKVNAGLSNIQDYYPGQTFANFTPLQEAGMLGNLDYAQNYYQPAAAGFQQQLGNYMDAPLNITNDPAVQNMMDANATKVTDWLNQTALPSVRSGAIGAGQYGGSRQGIAEGLALGKGAQALANANAQTALGAYGTASNLAANAAGQFPNALEMGFRPGDVGLQYGGAYQDMANKALQEQMTRYGYPEDALWNRMTQAGGILSGYPTGSTSTSDASASPLATVMGLGSLGLGAYNAGLFKTAAPVIEAGTAAAGLAGLGGTAAQAATLMGPSLSMWPTIAAAASDERLKENIVPDGDINGIPAYTFNYIGGSKRHRGVIAQEVLAIKPEAVVMMDNGYLAVDYGKL